MLSNKICFNCFFSSMTNLSLELLLWLVTLWGKECCLLKIGLPINHLISLIVHKTYFQVMQVLVKYWGKTEQLIYLGIWRCKVFHVLSASLWMPSLEYNTLDNYPSPEITLLDCYLSLGITSGHWQLISNLSSPSEIPAIRHTTKADSYNLT